MVSVGVRRGDERVRVPGVRVRGRATALVSVRVRRFLLLAKTVIC